MGVCMPWPPTINPKTSIVCFWLVYMVEEEKSNWTLTRKAEITVINFGPFYVCFKAGLSDQKDTSLHARFLKAFHKLMQLF